jgi:hypothetical protein
MKNTVLIGSTGCAISQPYVFVLLGFKVYLFRRYSHTIHHALAIWALGASSEAIKASYKAYLKPLDAARTSPEKITEENFLAHLGDETYVQPVSAYLTQ